MGEALEEISAMRRDMRRIEDDLADIARKKANNTDVEPVVAKQTSLEAFTRTRLEALHNDNEDIRNILKRMAESLTSIDDRLTKHKRDTDTELQSVKQPVAPSAPPKTPGTGLPIQIQIIMYILIGVGILALLQSAPNAVGGIMARFT